jgi:hypothetical protein
VPPLPLLELDGLCAKRNGHADQTGGIGLSRWSDGLLLGDGLPFAADLVDRRMVRTWVWVFEKHFLFLLPRTRVATQEAIMRIPIVDVIAVKMDCPLWADFVGEVS